MNKSFYFAIAIPHKLQAVSLHSFLDYFKVELDRCGLRSLLEDSKRFIYVTYFFNDVLWLFRALGLKIANKGIKTMTWIVWNAITPEYLKKL